MAKKTKKGEQLDLIKVGPANEKVIVKAVREYKGHQHDRMASLKLEVAAKEKVLALVKKADLQRLKDGVIKFTLGQTTIKITPQDDLIQITEKTPKKKKGMKGKIESKEQDNK